MNLTTRFTCCLIHDITGYFFLILNFERWVGNGLVSGGIAFFSRFHIGTAQMYGIRDKNQSAVHCVAEII